jgi:UDP-N-acetylmuramate dehydrogenase
MITETDCSLKPFNTFGVEARATRLVTITSVDELKQALTLPEVKNNNWLVIGGGSNVLFTHDFDGLVILNRIKGVEKIKEDDDNVWIKAGSGEVWHELVMWCVNRNYGGIENLSLIPGSVGAGPIQNIGAYGVEIKDVMDSVEVLKAEDATLMTLPPAACLFGYRDSIFKNQLRGKCIIVSVVLKLSKKPKINTSYGAIKQELERVGITSPGIRDVSQAVIRIRKSKLPDPAVLGNAGSFFKNPEIEKEHYDQLKAVNQQIPGFEQTSGKVKVPAGWLIEQCGLKGMRMGNTGTHKEQALVIVNYGHASGKEILNFADYITGEVKMRFGISLEKEVNIY